MGLECARSIDADPAEQPPAWVLDVLSDLQRVADRRGMDNFSAELDRMRAHFCPEK